ncbi:hypothetical protein ACFWCB_14300 [Streptomyces sp. NPDC060048]
MTKRCAGRAARRNALVPLVVKPMVRKETPRVEEKLKHLLEHSAA